MHPPFPFIFFPLLYGAITTIPTSPLAHLTHLFEPINFFIYFFFSFLYHTREGAVTILNYAGYGLHKKVIKLCYENEKHGFELWTKQEVFSFGFLMR